MVKRLFCLLSAISLVLCFASCSNKINNDYSNSIKKWANADFSHFTITSSSTYSKDNNSYTGKVTIETYSNSSDGKIVDRFYRHFTHDTKSTAVITEYFSDEYFDGTYYYHNQNGEMSYEKYLATDFISNSNLCINSHLFNFSEQQIDSAEKQNDGSLIFKVENPNDFTVTVGNITRIYSSFDVDSVDITSLTVTAYFDNDVLSGYTVETDLTYLDKSVSCLADINFLSDKDEVFVPNNLADYLTDDKKTAQDLADQLFEDGEKTENYDDIKQEIIKDYGDAGQQIIDQTAKDNGITLESSADTSSASSSQAQSSTGSNNADSNITSSITSSATQSENKPNDTSSDDSSIAESSNDTSSVSGEISSNISSSVSSQSQSQSVDSGIDVEFIE